MNISHHFCSAATSHEADGSWPQIPVGDDETFSPTNSRGSPSVRRERLLSFRNSATVRASLMTSFCAVGDVFPRGTTRGQWDNYGPGIAINRRRNGFASLCAAQNDSSIKTRPIVSRAENVTSTRGRVGPNADLTNGPFARFGRVNGPRQKTIRNDFLNSRDIRVFLVLQTFTAT